MPDREIKAHFIEPMLLLRTEKLPQGGLWVFELKLAGFRAEAIKSSGRVHLRSRNDKDFNARYPAIVQALAAMPDETVIDGEIVARIAQAIIDVKAELTVDVAVVVGGGNIWRGMTGAGAGMDRAQADYHLTLANTYEEAISVLFEALPLHTQKKFVNLRRGKMGEEFLGPSLTRYDGLQKLRRQQGSPILIVPAGIGYRDRSEPLSGAQELQENDLTLGVFEVACMLITHPERYAPQTMRGIDCSGDVYLPEGRKNAGIQERPYFYVKLDTILFSSGPGRLLESFGFIPEENIPS